MVVNGDMVVSTLLEMVTDIVVEKYLESESGHKYSDAPRLVMRSQHGHYSLV